MTQTDAGAIPNFPRIHAVTRADGSGEITIQGTAYPIPTTNAADARQAIVSRAVQTADKLNRPVKVATSGPDGDWPLIIHPDGNIEPDPTAAAAGKAPTAGKVRAGTKHDSPEEGSPSRPAGTALPDHTGTAGVTSHAPVTTPANPAPSSRTPHAVTPPQSEPSPGWPPAAGAPAPKPANTATSHGPARSFLTQPADRNHARWGWRGTLNKLGLKIAPAADEQSYLDDIAAVSKHWDGPKTVAVVNGKGGSGKTPTTIGLSATFAIHGGGGVVAWSNHQMRGTLGWHTVQSAHAATTQDLLDAAPDLLTTAGRSGSMARYVHHQPHDRYDVLQADPTKTSDQQRTGYRAVDTIHELLCRFYRLVIMDSDNDESTPHWLRMIDKADLVVVATTTDPVRAEAGRLMLDSLRARSPHARDLANNAVVVVSQAHSDEPPAAGVAQQFRDELDLSAATIPYDQGMKRLKINHAGLQPATQRAYLAAAAMVARALT